ncbi:MAG: energy transducer TonB [Candidatus Kaelpia imicola]|nr:energy transducer TonB [Candidatus Kaelpia imicola]
MIRDNLIKRALFVSLLFHFALLVPWRGISLIKPNKNRVSGAEPVVVSYKISNKKEVEIQKVEVLKRDQKAEAKDSERKPFEGLKDDITLVEKEKHEQSSYLIEEDEIVSLSGKMNSHVVPAILIEYYSSIREEIKKKAFYYKPVQGRGAVTVLFGIDSKGLLKRLTIDDIRSTNQKNLRTAALNSVKHAAPFSPFPPELKNSIITFSITIEFALGSN